jgi:hypothetical protein
MFAWLTGKIASALGGQIVGGLVDGYKAKLAAGNDASRIAADLAGRELTVQQREIEVQGELRKAQVGVWYEPEKIMGYTVAIYFGKLLIWDKVLGLGTTDALTGWAGTTASLIVAAYFGKRSVETAIRIWKAK